MIDNTKITSNSNNSNFVQNFSNKQYSNSLVFKQDETKDAFVSESVPTKKKQNTNIIIATVLAGAAILASIIIAVKNHKTAENTVDKLIKNALEKVKPENKDFIIKQVIPTIAKHLEKIEFHDPLNIPLILKHITQDNIESFIALTEKAKDLEIKSWGPFTDSLKKINKDNQKFVINDLIPTIIQNKDKLKIKSGLDWHELIDIVNPENKDRIFYEYLPFISHNSKKLEVLDFSDVKKYIQYMDENGKDFVFNEAIPFVRNNEQKFNINYQTDKFKDVLLLTTKKNIGNLKIVADNIEKLKISNGYKIYSFLNLFTHKASSDTIDNFLALANKNLVLKQRWDTRNISSIIRYINENPEKKDFILNQAIPMIAKTGENIGLRLHYGDDSLYFDEVLNKLTSDNLEHLEIISTNKEKFGINWRADWMKVCELLTKTKEELTQLKEAT